MIRRLTDKPVSRIVNSHWHPDHWSGNEVYARAFPGVEIVATTATRDYMARTVQSMRYVLRKGVNANQQSATLRMEEEFVAEFERSQPVFPNVTFDGRMVVQDAPRTFELMTLFGDASSVAVAYLPRALETGVLTADLPKSLRLESIGKRFRAQTEVSEADFSAFVQELMTKVAQESRDGAQFRP
jgi:hypothetical protein